MTPPTGIGTALVRTRRAQGLSQRELGRRVGVVQQQIARWEAAAYRTAPLERVESVARSLGLTLAAAGWGPVTGLLAAESPASYGTSAPTGVAPVRDLGEVAARIRLFRACHLRRGDHGA